MFSFADSLNGINSRQNDGGWIPLKRLRHPTQLIYGSALPQHLGREDASGLASWLVDQCDRLRQGTHPLLLDQAEEFSAGLRTLLREFTVMATPAGTLQMRLHDRAIAHWLTVILNLEFSPAAKTLQAGRSLSPQRLWTVQYAHARCCSLLRHAQSSAWIPLVPSVDGSRVDGSGWEVPGVDRSSVDGSSATGRPWQWVGDAVPWLTDSDTLVLWHPSQWQVMVALLALLDQWSESGADLGQQEWRLAEQLSLAFQTFYAACPPFAMVRWQNRDRASCYIALIVAIQRMLWYSLTHHQVVIPAQL